MKRVGYKENWIDKLYIPAVLKGMWVTLKHLITPQKNITIQYPEYKWKPFPKYRGAHRLNKDEQGRIKCVACEMCATACPAKCISITPAPAPWEDRERYPIKFEINMLRCIFCGYCEDACPTEAIVLGHNYELSFTNRRDAIYTKEMLLMPVPQNGKPTPMPVEPGSFDRSIPEMEDPK